MNANRLSVGGWLALLALSCAVDRRPLSLVKGRGTDAGAVGADGGAAAPRLVVGPDELDLGWVSTGFPARARVRVSNAGEAPLPAPVVTWATGSDADYTLIQNQCLADVAPGTSCEVRVQLIPTKAGELQATLRVEGGGVAADVALKALGQPSGDMILAPTAGSFEDFGGVRTGGTAQGVFSISNPTSLSSGPLEFNSSRPEFSLLAPEAGDCVPGVTSLVDGESCTVRVAFTPMDRGPVEGTLTGLADGVGSVSLALTGNGLIPAQPFASAAELDFEGVVLGQAAQRSVIFGNQGDEAWALAGVRVEPPEAEGFTLLSSDCGDVALTGTQTCEVQLEFRPGRVGADFVAELVVAGVDEAQSLRSSLRGTGLEPGVLVVTPAAEGENDFGPVLVGENLVRVFTITNPSAQPSGVLAVQGSEGFEVLGPPGEGECVPESTSLVNGESCTVRVQFEPALRETRTGSLTVTSPLTAAAGLALSGQGISAATIEVEPELNFGRVLTNAPAERVLTLTNAGDEPLPPPLVELVAAGAAAGPAAPAAPGAAGAAGAGAAPLDAFSFENGCTEPLAFEATCDITVRFAPTAAAPHTANLKLSGEPGGTSTVLLLGEALAPGVLVLAPEEAGGNAFGDVPIGTPATRSFTLTNPNGVPSGAVTITTDDNHFAVKPGTCGALAPDGLVDGAVCGFDVSFAPDGSDEVVANIAIQSPGAGRAGLELRGRGRAPAKLAGTDKHDMGRAIVGQMPPPPPSPFVWTLKNGGDLATGALALNNDNAAEFVVGPDTCSRVAVAGGASCQVTIAFKPGAAGARAAELALVDPATQLSTRLALTGVGVVLAGPGQACTNDGECAEGVCSNDRLCCDRLCDRACETCIGTSGACTEQHAGEECGPGGAQCFAVESCKLPAGQPCSGGASGDAQCGDGNCEVRLGGTGAICCLEDCAAGEQCSVDGAACEAPTAGADALCGASAANLECGGGLQCKLCLNGENRCTAREACCGGCGTGTNLTCNPANGTCECTGTGTSGGALVACSDGRCIESGGSACCDPVTCPTDAPKCDATGVCQQCLANTDCGACRNCNAGTCQPLGADEADRCEGEQVCDANLICAEPRTFGQSCGAGQVCTQGVCGVSNVCCTESTCTLGCGADGVCTQNTVAVGADGCSATVACVAGAAACVGGRCCSEACPAGCDATGACVAVAVGADGCSATVACVAGAAACVGGRCCSEACPAGCDATGACVAVGVGVDGCSATVACVAGAAACVGGRCCSEACPAGCDATGACVAVGVGVDGCSATVACVAGAAACVGGRCCSEACPAGCDATGACVAVGVGVDGCSATVACVAGAAACVGGRCCSEACPAGCDATGACVAVGVGVDGCSATVACVTGADACVGGRCCSEACSEGCDTTGACTQTTVGLGVDGCNDTVACVTGADACVGGRCCSEACAAGCDTAGACLPEPIELGGAGCATGGTCVSGECSNDQCCNEQCVAGCDDTGTCFVVAVEPLQLPIGGTGCREANTVCLEGACTSGGQCCLPECPNGCDPATGDCLSVGELGCDVTPCNELGTCDPNTGECCDIFSGCPVASDP